MIITFALLRIVLVKTLSFMKFGNKVISGRWLLGNSVSSCAVFDFAEKLASCFFLEIPSAQYVAVV